MKLGVIVGLNEGNKIGVDTGLSLRIIFNNNNYAYIYEFYWEAT